MLLDKIRTCLNQFQEVRLWPDFADFLRREMKPGSKPCWEYCCDTARSFGVGSCPVEPAAAICCMLASIHLVDDMLDEDPRGLYRTIGFARAANLALGFQSTAIRLVAGAEVAPHIAAAATENLAKMSLNTGFGQMLDACGSTSEEAYWEIVRRKTPPLFCSAFFLGALFAGATRAQAEQVEGLGIPLGELIQVSDDLNDVFERPAAPDWKRSHGSLPIMFARLADHSERSAFLELCSRIEEPEALGEAQAILVRSGAVSYCIHRITTAYDQAKQVIASADLVDAEPLNQLLEYLYSPARQLILRTGTRATSTEVG